MDLGVALKVTFVLCESCIVDLQDSRRGTACIRHTTSHFKSGCVDNKFLSRFVSTNNTFLLEFNFHGSMHHVKIFVNKTSLMQFFRYLLYPIQLYVFRKLRPSIHPSIHPSFPLVHNCAPEDGWT